MWRIYYADGTVIEGRSAAEWRAAPNNGVQVVVRFPPVEPVRWKGPAGAVQDRDLWTGDDLYDPFGWGEKRGSLMEWEDYTALWEKACTDGLS